ncbi:MAG: hypothetical protein HY589_04100 [Candidatus Omnitrophica bacterium]|nr:hypothetical protein [Candidatus Omnitrophota bacterium]
MDTINKRGIALIAAYAIIALLLFIVGVTFVSRSLNEKHSADRHKNQTMAFYLAESGLEGGLGWLRAQSSPPAGTAAFDPFGGAQNLGKGAYSVIIDPDDNNLNSVVKRYKIISTGVVQDVSQKLVNEVQTDHYARFAYFSDTEHFRWYGWYRVPVWFIGQDLLEGPVQTNSHFHIKGNPVFKGQVKSQDNFLTFFNNGAYIDSTQTSNSPSDVPVFEQGISLGADSFQMPSKALDLRTAAVQGGLQLTGSTEVVLNSDGTMNVTNSHEHWSNQNMALPANGALFIEGGDLTISGALNGRLSVGTNRNVVINNNLTYADDPRVNPNSDDMLGLIAEKDVVISQAAPSNVEVDASIMALGNSFIVENWWVGPAKDKLTVYGGMIQRERGPVGTFNGATGQKLSGYSKDYHYDPRLVGMPPPYYPKTGDYVSLSWKEE